MASLRPEAARVGHVATQREEMGAERGDNQAVIGQRLKQSGMHRTVNGADAIIACAAPRPAASGKSTATSLTLRQEPPDQPARQNDLQLLQI
jgi:hypothetical protein